MPHPDRLYYSDSFLTTFTGSVSKSRNSPDESLWQLSLNQTAFYPTSGGQPFDTGVLRLTSPDTTEIPVEEVSEDEEGTVWHSVRQPLEAGTEVEGRIDWARRFDHMQQHTGQHLLSAIFLRESQAPTVSFHLGDTSSTIDLAVAQPAHLDLEKIERITNEIIGEDRAVTTCYVSRDQAESMLAAGELRKLPDRQGDIRLIDIADCDRNACGGTHVRSTGQIGGLLLRGVEKVSRGVRIEFVCGLRAVRTARRDAAILTETAGLLSIGAPEMPAAVKRMQAEAKTHAREHQRINEELATLLAAQLISEEPIENGLRLLIREWNDRDRDFVRLLASRTSAAASSTVVVLSAKESDPVRLFLARSPDLKFHCGTTLKEALSRIGLRGGGSPDLAQGDVPKEQAQTLVKSIIDEIRKSVMPQKPD